MLALLGLALAEMPQCVELSEPYPARSIERVGTARNAAWLALKGWQLLVAPADGAGCSMYPSCSRYAMFAVQEAGPIRGTFMATARILRHHRDPDMTRCKVGERTYLYDPVDEDIRW
jgi:putative component of membrane protein insertase Oxa1/YidC/SpoIIIJ protein YidD